jgi:hypothetical protein
MLRKKARCRIAILVTIGFLSQRIPKHQECEYRTCPSEIVYGAVIDQRDFDTDMNRKFCSTNTKSDWAHVCANIKDYNEARIAIFHHSRLIAPWVAVPKSWNIKNEAVLRVRPSTAIATEVSASTPRAGCSWTGYSLDNLIGRAGIVKGFAAGMLIVPGVVMLADDSIMEGGVECDGWSYKSLLIVG